MVLTYNYDTTYPGPPFPIVEVAVQAVGKTGETIALRALVDSGADATMIPLRELRRLAARQVDTRYAYGITGIRYPVDIYEVGLQIGPYRIPKVYAVADVQNGEMILGRDALNQFIVTLNGLANIVEISQ
ncbi:MAG: retroviral-like aspartic protease family protein [Anaerolineales bacterium]|nr:retroviral-like aspartic protease family protein [Anaerolineales bacterium]